MSGEDKLREAMVHVLNSYGADPDFIIGFDDMVTSLLWEAASSPELHAERDKARAQVRRVAAIHRHDTYLDNDDFVCSHCLVVVDNGYGHRPAPWPCATIAALEVLV